MKIVVLLAVMACGGGPLPPEARFYPTPVGVRVAALPDAELAAFQTELDRVAGLWDAVLPGSRAQLTHLRVRVEKLPFYDGATCAVGCAGLYVPDRSLIRVGWAPGVAWGSTALGHELGHHFLYTLRGDASEAGLRAFTEKYGLPY